nr:MULTISPECIES: ribonuclease H-like domain-containing protein [Corynebacterium]
MELLPHKSRLGDKVAWSRVDVPFDDDNAVELTLEAIATGARVITGAVLENSEFRVYVDFLVRMDHTAGFDDRTVYAPVVISSHAVARPAKSSAQADCAIVDLAALGLSKPIPVAWRHRTVAGEGQRAAMAHTILKEWGRAAAEVGFIGRAGASPRVRCFFYSAEIVMPGLMAALSESIPTRPSRVKECKVCEFHNHCRLQLLETADISLLLPGDKNRKWRERGIDTLPQLMAANVGETSQLARAWLQGKTILRREYSRWVSDPLLWGNQEFVLEGKQAPMARELAKLVEVDVDMEAHPNRGTFLWGTFDGSRYVAFSDFSADGDEGQHVAEFWEWLQQSRAAAERDGKTLRVWVYAAQGENHWLRYYARQFGGREYRVEGTAGSRVIAMPSIQDVEAFINSDAWCDIFPVVRKALASSDSLGLKTIAPLAGFEFSQEGVNGRAAVDLFEKAVGRTGSEAAVARRTLERYNADDCVATASVRAWLRRGAPGVDDVASGEKVNNSQP